MRPAVLIFRRGVEGGEVLSLDEEEYISVGEGVVLLDEVVAIIPWGPGAAISLRCGTTIFAEEPSHELIKRWLSQLIEHHEKPYRLLPEGNL